jgi:hypothetical protein
MAHDVVRDFRVRQGAILSQEARRKSPVQILFELYRGQGSFRFLLSFALLGSIVLAAMSLGPLLKTIQFSGQPEKAVVVPAADKRAAALASASQNLDRERLGPPRPDAYKLLPSVFASAPRASMGQLLAAADAYSRKEPAASVLAKIEPLDPGEPNAAFMRGLGTLGIGGRANSEAGLALLQRAAEARHNGAMALYGLAKLNPPGLLEKDPAEGRRWLQRAIDAGDGQAAFLLGYAYLSGWAGVADPAKSVALFRIAADAGHLDAMKLLGMLALKGQGMPRDISESEKYFRQAAQLGDVEAQGILGVYLIAASLGGWEASFAEAIHWLTRSAEAGEVKAMRELGMLHLAYAEGTAFHDVKKGLDWMRRCAALKEPQCHFALGRAYETGTGANEDPVRAAAHYSQALIPPTAAKAKQNYDRLTASFTDEQRRVLGRLEAQLRGNGSGSLGSIAPAQKPVLPSAAVGAFRDAAAKAGP